jgi:hypothetical protein
MEVHVAIINKFSGSDITQCDDRAKRDFEAATYFVIPIIVLHMQPTEWSHPLSTWLFVNNYLVGCFGLESNHHTLAIQFN